MAEKRTKNINCPHHGTYVAEVVFVAGKDRFSSCPKCLEERNVKEAEELKKEAARKIADRKSASGIPLKYKTACFETLVAAHDKQAFAIRYAKRYAEAFEKLRSEGCSIVFYGDPGTGKTHLACAIALHVIKAGFSAKYITAFDLLNAISDTFRTKQPTHEVVSEYTQTSLLVLDEVGMQYGKEHDIIWLYKIINTRYVNNLPTIVISNLDEKKLEEFIGSPTYDRLQEGKGAAIPFFWESHRRKTALKLAS